ncbi:precorrin-3B synthase [Brucella abortus]|uniref:precorrin-3B synthase n=1 Tax=Brucella abortus TaxID=235 RepID=UPI0001B54DEE|nr:precorrin-3B synthase [Brucella abortus]AIJ60179.1 precorrin-3B synthase [Brucella abortus bv. 9 str. C68]AIJ79513.1 precorrin-3B synthase [Brucella abortus]AIK03465.1 precorrin-3B synthase [Brucella abortus]EEX80626.1 precorrin-3B synthase [Brucella abortus bv. 9 str. C68]EFH35098.1 precorrin-3B synthase [Brucella abortus bv. 5 str. B3196]
MLNQQTIQNQSDRRSACPGLSRMVMAKDGAIARIKLRLGRLSTQQAFALADIAEHSGARAIELSIRSNVQLRGIAPARWDEFVTALYEAGLGADNPAADDIRNVMVSPTAGIDPGQICDVTGLASDLLAMLQAEKAFHALSPKFSLQVDGGEDCAMISHPGDIWLSATEEGKAYVFGLASSPDRQALGTIAANNVPPFIDALLRCFLRNGAARMKQLTSEREFVKTVRESLPFAIEPAYGWKRKATVAHAHLGQHRQLYSNHYIGAMPLLGRLTPLQLRELARLAQEELRLTPWQGILLPNIAPGETDRIKRALHATGLETSPKSAHARLRACSGATGCASALADTQADGNFLAARLESGSDPVHLTGCAKSCAALAPLPHTLLARSAGRYDLYAQDRFSQNGAGPSRFGQLLASDITLEEAAHILNARHQ